MTRRYFLTSELHWLDSVLEIEELEDAEFDPGLVARFEQQFSSATPRLMRFSTPTFRDYTSNELEGCSNNSFPAFSITAGESSPPGRKRKPAWLPAVRWIQQAQ
jgi:hypothetical protein